MRVVRANRRHGSALVEFALILPVLLLLTAGLLDIGRAYSQMGAITNAARQGARVAMADRNTTDAVIRTRVREELVGSGVALDALVDADIAITRPATVGERTSGTPVTVAITNNFRPLMGSFLRRNNIRIQRQCTMAHL